MTLDDNQRSRDAAANRRIVLEQIPVDLAAGYFELRRKTGLAGADLDEALAELRGLGVIISKNTVSEVLYWRASAVQDKEWYSVEDAANYLSVSKRTVQQLIRDGEMIAYRVGQGGHRRIRRTDLDGPMHREDHSGLMELAGADDPVLSQLWGNDHDAAYDRL